MCLDRLYLKEGPKFRLMTWRVLGFSECLVVEDLLAGDFPR